MTNEELADEFQHRYDAVPSGDINQHGEASDLLIDMLAYLRAAPAEPVAWQQLKNGKWIECSHFVAHNSITGSLDKGCRPLYAQAAPSGWVMVPRDPTVDMLEFGAQEQCAGVPTDYMRETARRIYIKMLAAASPPRADGEGGGGRVMGQLRMGKLSKSRRLVRQKYPNARIFSWRSRV